MIRMGLIAWSAILLAGCAEVTPITTPGGRPGFVVSCDGADSGWEDCYEAASDACDGGRYVVIDRPDRRYASRGGNKRTLVVRCKRRGRDDD